MNGLIHILIAGVFSTAALSASGQYHLERISPVLNQPNYLTQAPGDPTNILYYTTRMNPTNRMGSVWRYDVATRASTVVLDLSNRSISGDDGLQCIAFHPDYNLPGSNGYGKLYVCSAQFGSTGPTNRVEEYSLDPANPAAGATFSRLILSYKGNQVNNHTIDWVGFDPTATGQARNCLYISTGDGAYGNNYGNGIFPAGRPSQNPADVRGKILRVDISGPDDYPADAEKNFAIPPDSPVPMYNALHPGAPLMGTNFGVAVPALGEVFVTGVRNGYRVSFDRANGDMYIGDVGENAHEEISFLKAGSNSAGPPADFGWPQFEADFISTIADVPHTATNPFTGALSTMPVREWPHAVVGGAAIGGYVYRGPIQELQGKYLFADFAIGKVWMLDFDRNTSPNNFIGENGTLTELNLLWNQLAIDPTDPAYRGDTNRATIAGLDFVVSFGEDNEGNLFVLDFSSAGQYAANSGEIFKLVPGPAPGPTLNWTRTGTNLQFSWSGNVFKLQVQTNGPGTNWLDYPDGGTSPSTVPLQVPAGAVFFRLKSK
jgi:glucose/arabinose dehydrogenase